MSDLRYSATLDTSQAERNLDRFQKAVVNVNDTFIRFRNTIATISLGAFLQQTINSAARLDALSRSTGIAADTLKGFSDAVRAGGGNADQAADAISDLVKNIGDAATGGADLVKAFAKAGVSMQELRTASEEDILRKTIDGIAKIGDSSTQSAVKAKIFGEALKTVNFNAVNGGFSQFIANARGYSVEAKAAADAQRQFATAVDKLQTIVLKISKPLLDLVNAIDLTSAAMSKFFAVLGEAIKFAAIAAGILLVGKALAFIVSVGTVAAGVMKTMSLSIAGLFRVLTTPLLRADLFKNLAMLSPGLASRVKAVTEAMGVPIAWLAAHWKSLTIAVGAGIGAIKEYLGLGKDAEKPPEPPAEEKPEGEVDRGLENAIQRAVKFNEELSKQRLTYQQLSSDARRQSNLLEQDLKFQLRKLKMGEDEIELAEALTAETNRYIQQRDDLDKKFSDINLQLTLEQNKRKTLHGTEAEAADDRIQLLTMELDEIRRLGDEYYRIHMSNGRAIEDNIGAIQRIRNEEKARQRDLEYNTKILEQQFKTQQSLEDILRNINDKKVELRFEQSLDKLSPLQRRIAEIQENARKAAVEAGRAFAGSFEEEDGLSPERAEQLAEGLRAIAQGFKDIATQQVDAITQFKTFQELLEENFKAYAEDALDSNKQIKDSFENTVKGLEDAFVKFALTGKLSFQDMANSILADLARIAVRRAIVFAGSALFGMPIPGRAEGGPVDARSPYIVGERGPELFIPAAAGKIVPNAQLGGQGMAQSGATAVTYNINAVDAASFRALVARDPSFIYSVTEQGRRNTPSRSR